MLLYRITYLMKDEITKDPIEKVKWAGSQKQAASIRANKRHMKAYVPNSIQTEKIDVPTTKDKLISWLNWYSN